jgi:4-aminobutyrate aminotransferase-like enzyme
MTASEQLAADALRNDPRIAEAKRLLMEAVNDHRSSINKVLPPNASLKHKYKQMLDDLATNRGGATYFPYISSGLGNGPFVELADGSVKLDFIVGIGVHGLGHSHLANVAATVDAAIEDTVMQGNLQQSGSSAAMMSELLQLARPEESELQHVMLTTSGAMSNENALKIAMHARTPANRVICIENCFAGRSLALAALTDRPAYRTGLPLTLDVDYLTMFHPSDPEGTTKSAINGLKRLIARYPGQHACIWIELVAGEGGYYPGTREYFTQLCQICRQNNITIIFDEVQTFGRLSQPFAFQHFGLEKFADIVTIGKITQLCATLYRTGLKPKGPILSQTFTAASASIHAGLAAIRELKSKNCFGEDGWNMQRHRHWVSRMEDLRARYPGKISGPYGEGMMLAFTPGDGDAAKANELTLKLFDLGLMGFLAGSNPTRLRFLPSPGIATEAHIDMAVEIIESTL